VQHICNTHSSSYNLSFDCIAHRSAVGHRLQHAASGCPPATANGEEGAATLLGRRGSALGADNDDKGVRLIGPLQSDEACADGSADHHLNDLVGGQGADLARAEGEQEQSMMSLQSISNVGSPLASEGGEEEPQSGVWADEENEEGGDAAEEPIPGTTADAAVVTAPGAEVAEAEMTAGACKVAASPEAVAASIGEVVVAKEELGHAAEQEVAVAREEQSERADERKAAAQDQEVRGVAEAAVAAEQGSAEGGASAAVDAAAVDEGGAMPMKVDDEEQVAVTSTAGGFPGGGEVASSCEKGAASSGTHDWSARSSDRPHTSSSSSSPTKRASANDPRALAASHSSKGRSQVGVVPSPLFCGISF